MRLNSSYNRNDFLGVIKNLDNDFKTTIQEFDYNSNVIVKAYLLGKIESVDTDVIEIEITGNVRNRIKITSEAFKILKSISSSRAIISFFSSTTNSGRWRLSLLTTDYKIIDGEISKEQSNPKRHSYLLGDNAKVVTPTRYLLNKGELIDFEDLRSRFSLSVVNEEFYIQLADLYTKLIGGKRNKGSGSIEHSGLLKINGVKSQKLEHQEFAIKLIGRLVFCWFLKEKKSKNGSGLIPEQLLSSKFVKTGNYYNQILEPLFFELLNTKIGKRKEKYSDKKYQIIPYLNGGLYKPQPQDFYSDKNFGRPENELPVYIPNEWFIEFYELLEQYNFTVDENTSNDIELSIDPEMLGRIFENLLAEINPETGETARKSTGSFYTPRNIVDYMVNGSLSYYLLNKTGIEKTKLDNFINEVGTTENINYDFSENEIESIVNSISTIKVIDPACGSGAFPIGILQKAVAILQFVDPESKRWIDIQLKNAPIELKKQIMERFNKNGLNYLRKLGLIKESCVQDKCWFPINELSINQ